MIFEYDLHPSNIPEPESIIEEPVRIPQSGDKVQIETKNYLADGRVMDSRPDVGGVTVLTIHTFHEKMFKDIQEHGEVAVMVVVEDAVEN